MDRRKLVTRGVVLVVSVALIGGAIFSSANADSSLQRALRTRKATVAKLQRIHELRRIARQNLHRQIRTIQSKIRGTRRALDRSLATDRTRSSRREAKLVSWRRGLRIRLRKLERFVRRRTVELRARRTQLSSWIQTYGVLRRCPVQGPVSIANDFGVMVAKRKGVPRHVHQGNDMSAAAGTPIVAPFDGVAEATPNKLGGIAVTVYGAQGYVYNAHMSAYGKLGNVKAGDVIGYVGATGDTGANHDHFEWHPGNGAAVDPYPYLMAVCSPSANE